ncbi:hypothetical protein [Macrococcus capreoli]|uniref:hypothetical protein n=1 Tax=Macrococcus capreoli TaxID=2982690 RepID=UPI003EE64565
MITERGLTGREFKRYNWYREHAKTLDYAKSHLEVIVDFYNNSDLRTQQFIKLLYFENTDDDTVMAVFEMTYAEFNRKCRKLQRALDMELTKRGL